MTRGDIECALRALQRDPKGIVNRPHAATLRDALAAPWMDGALAASVIAALDAAGIPATWTPPPLRVGETWLLLCDPARRRGHALRWRSRLGGQSAALTRECEDALDCAWRGLHATLATRQRALPGDFSRGGFEVPGLSPSEHVDGASLGVSACLAWLSRALGAPCPAHLAASAAVRSDGALAPVELLDEKLAALRASAPAVTHVIVAHAQPYGGVPPDGLVLLRCATLAEAIDAAGFNLDPLPLRPIEMLLAAVAGFAAENARANGSDRWRALSQEAWSVAQGLAQDPHERSKASEARVWAALFALHAGDDATARDIVRSVDDLSNPRVRLWRAIVEAATLIDRERFTEALETLDACADTLRTLSEEFRWMEGHALGTRGRALLHGGRHTEALQSLEETVRWFMAQSMPWEAARTSKDVATCLRLLHRPADARATVDHALGLLDTHAPRRAVSAKTRDFLQLERGRCLLALDAPHDAQAAFAHVLRAQSRDTDYPRLGALRGLLVAHRRAGQTKEADACRTRLHAVASSPEVAPTLRRVAAVAAGEALVDGDAETFGRLREAWTQHFPDASDDAAVRAVLALQVY
jgi:tetratricopeptide (TPR) repeat protein